MINRFNTDLDDLCLCNNCGIVLDMYKTKIDSNTDYYGEHITIKCPCCKKETVIDVR